MTPANIDMTYLQMLEVATGGALGAFIKDVLQDGCITLPFKKEGKLFLGFIGGALVGALVGLAVDGSFITAALGGYTGSSVLKNLINHSSTDTRTLDKKITFLKQQKKDIENNPDKPE